MRKIILLILVSLPLIIFSQDETCAFSDGHFYYHITLEENQIPSLDFDKTDFINLLETNSNISASNSQLLEDSIIEVSRWIPDFSGPDDDPQRGLYVIANSFNLDSFFNSLEASISSSFIYCNCLFTDGYYYNFTAIVTDVLPPINFDKSDFIEHLEINSDITLQEVDFLNLVIEDVYLAFPSSQQDHLRKAVFIKTNFDLLFRDLENYTESLQFAQLNCYEAELSLNEYNIKEYIKIIPNPIDRNSYLLIEHEIKFRNLEIIDINGKLIHSKNIKDQSIIYLSQFDLVSGLYFLKLNGADQSIVKKVIVK